MNNNTGTDDKTRAVGNFNSFQVNETNRNTLTAQGGNGQSNDQTNANNRCPICHDPVNNRSFIQNCLHEYCLDCINMWSNENNTCPVCRQPYSHIISNVRSDSDYDINRIPFQPFQGLQYMFQPIDEPLQVFQPQVQLNRYDFRRIEELLLEDDIRPPVRQIRHRRRRHIQSRRQQNSLQTRRQSRSRRRQRQRSRSQSDGQRRRRHRRRGGRRRRRS
ncbi:uncharacterized protein LOC128955897 [Oppia nitens]|uniref:uncharacterized protein LOC128955897 n=1 Tax=Oppia nitens TaxID=1686743 RepID=UPI0023DAE647|nr:uncharacterized protein LOC128955897 [Oppia nitens]